VALPGGDIAIGGLAEEAARLCASCPSCQPEHATRLVCTYGTRARMIVKSAIQDGWGKQFGEHLTECEVRYLIDQEWALTAEDVLWRRTKLGLRISEAEAARLGEFMAQAAGTAQPVRAAG
jgi:glycerol-3-phosphate dehydrogenase